MEKKNISLEEVEQERKTDTNPNWLFVWEIICLVKNVVIVVEWTSLAGDVRAVPCWLIGSALTHRVFYKCHNLPL